MRQSEKRDQREIQERNRLDAHEASNVEALKMQPASHRLLIQQATGNEQAAQHEKIWTPKLSRGRYWKQESGRILTRKRQVRRQEFSVEPAALFHPSRSEGLIAPRWNSSCLARCNLHARSNLIRRR